MPSPSWIHWLFNQYMELGFYPKHFRKSITVILKKVGKKDYTIFKAYRPVALFNVLNKTVESIITNRIKYLTKMHNLLLTNYIKKKISSMKTILHIILNKIYTIRKFNKIIIKFFFNILKTYDNVMSKLG